jgi:hypothetical protein
VLAANLKKILICGRHPGILGLLAVLTAATLPLGTSTGANLEYEYALITSWLTLILVPLGVLFLARRPPEGRDLLWWLASPLVTLLPGSLAFATSRCACSPQGWLFWMALQWLPAACLTFAFTVSLSHIKTPTRWKKVAGLWLVYTLLILTTAATLWFFPQKRTTSLLLGFLHGPVYDDWIPVDAGIALLRASHALIGLALIAFFHRRWLSAAFLVLSLVCQGWSNQWPSTGHGTSALKKLLPETLAGAGWTLHGTWKSSEIPREIKALGDDINFHVSELRGLIGNTPHVDIWLYPDQDSKKLWFGGGGTDVTDVFTPSVHITQQARPHPTLRHELAHALTSDLAFHGLGFHPNMAITEGVAVALAPEDRALSLDDSSAAILASGRVTSLESLFTPLGFWTESGARAYTLAGSFLAWFKRSKGASALLELYSGASLADAHGAGEQSSARKILEHWKDDIFKGRDAEATELTAEALFRAPSVFAATCPHSLEDLRRSSDKDPWLRLRQPLAWTPDPNWYLWRLSLDPDDRESQLDWLKKRVDAAAAKVISRAENPNPKDLAELQELTWAFRNQAPSPEISQQFKVLEDLEEAILQSDLLRLLGDEQASVEILKGLNDWQQTRQLPGGLTRQIGARLLIELTPEITDRAAWRNYLAGWQSKIPELAPEGAQRTPWILRYLRLRRSPPRDFVNAAFVSPLHDQDLEPIIGTRPWRALAMEWYRVLALEMENRGDPLKAAESWDQALTFADPGRRAWTEEQARRNRAMVQTQ